MEQKEKIKVLSDSTCDLTPEEVEALGIELIPVEIILGTDVYLDGEGINARRVLEYTKKTGQLPKTAATNTERFKSYFKKYQDQGYKVIHFNISSKASGMHANAVAAARTAARRRICFTLWTIFIFPVPAPRRAGGRCAAAVAASGGGRRPWPCGGAPGGCGPRS